MSEDDDTHENETSEIDEAAPDSSHKPRGPESGGTRSAGGESSPVPLVKRRTGVNWRTLALGFGAAGLCILLGTEITYIAKSTFPQRSIAEPDAAAPSTSVVLGGPRGEISDAATPDVPSIADTPIDTIALSSTTPAEDAFVEEPQSTKPEKPRHFKTVQEAANASCSTSSVDGLSRQIIEQVRCTNPTTFVPLPPRPNLVLEPQIFPYLELSARDHLVRVLDANRHRKMTIHSALRTLPQQYLVWRWAANRRCGVQMATPPGSSNHETGRALDIADHAQWRPALEAEDFHWLGASDLVHFDYKTNRQLGLAPDVLAFQRLWNRNHPDDKIAETGRYDPSTEQHLKNAPPSGFSAGTTCSKKSVRKTTAR